MKLDIKEWITSITNATPIGTVEMYAGSTAPSGWKKCDGSAISRTTYKALFDVIGTTWGAGDGSTTFNLPNLVDRMPVGAGSSYALNAAGGSIYIQQHTHSYTNPTLPNHVHTPGSHTHTTNIGAHGHSWSSTYALTSTASVSNNTTIKNGTGTSYANVMRTTGTLTRDNIPSATIGNKTSGGPSASNTGNPTSNPSCGGGVGNVKDLTTGTAGNMPPYRGINFIIYVGA